MTDTPEEHTHDEDENDRPQTFSPPTDMLMAALRQEIARANDERIMLEAQVNFQAQIIQQLQSQLQALDPSLLEAEPEPAEA